MGKMGHKVFRFSTGEKVKEGSKRDCQIWLRNHGGTRAGFHFAYTAKDSIEPRK